MSPLAFLRMRRRQSVARLVEQLARQPGALGALCCAAGFCARLLKFVLNAFPQILFDDGLMETSIRFRAYAGSGRYRPGWSG